MTTKTLKASSGRPLPVHASQHGSVLWCTLHPKPRSRVMSDLCLLWTPCASVLVSWCICTAILTHSFLRAPYKTLPGQSSLHAIPLLPFRPVQKGVFQVPFKIFIFLSISLKPFGMGQAFFMVAWFRTTTLLTVIS